MILNIILMCDVLSIPQLGKNCDNVHLNSS